MKLPSAPAYTCTAKASFVRHPAPCNLENLFSPEPGLLRDPQADHQLIAQPVPKESPSDKQSTHHPSRFTCHYDLKRRDGSKSHKCRNLVEGHLQDTALTPAVYVSSPCLLGSMMWPAENLARLIKGVPVTFRKVDLNLGGLVQNRRPRSQG